jgi:hypothetical protein
MVARPGPMRQWAARSPSLRGRAGAFSGMPCPASTSSRAEPPTPPGTRSRPQGSGITTASATTPFSESGSSSEVHDPPGAAALLVDAGVLSAGPVVPPDPLEVRDLDEDQRDDDEEEELAAHLQTVSGPDAERNRPVGLDGLGDRGAGFGFAEDGKNSSKRKGGRDVHRSGDSSPDHSHHHPPDLSLLRKRERPVVLSTAGLSICASWGNLQRSFRNLRGERFHLPGPSFSVGHGGGEPPSPGRGAAAHSPLGRSRGRPAPASPFFTGDGRVPI